MRNKRRLERAYHRTGLVVDRVRWTKAIRDMHTLFNSKERAYWEAKVAPAASNSKKRWQTLNKLMCKDVKSQIPDSATAEAFSKFFTHKVESVRSATENAAPPSFSPCPKPCCFDTFQPLTPEQVSILIKRAPDKTSDLDPVPTWLVQEFAPIFAPFFAHVFNVSLEKGYLPASQKKAIVYPGLKKPSLDPDDLSNYRPISNLSFVSKLLERAVHAQLLLYLNDNELLPSVQSAYRQFFSTETAVLKVVTDTLAALDRGQISLLGMFDLSAAFDTVDHSILLRRMEISFGIRGAALEWFSSYLTGRSQQVSVHNVMAMSAFLDYGVPQGSVLGPVLFLLYTSDLVELVRSFGLLAHAYADDLQVYCHMNVGSEQIMLQRFRDCADSVSRWMSSNRLKLNPSKTELIWFYSGRRQLSFVENDIELFGNRIAPVHTVRDLGVMLDSKMTMSQHISRVCQNCYFQIRLIRRLGKALSVESKLLLVHALVHSRLDYCNSVLARLPWSLVQQLQSVLNSAARLIFGLKRFDHITPALMDLHWLPYPQRITRAVDESLGTSPESSHKS